MCKDDMVKKARKNKQSQDYYYRNREKVLENMRKYLKKIWNDPKKLEEYRRKQREYKRKSMSNPEIRAKKRKTVTVTKKQS